MPRRSLLTLAERSTLLQFPSTEEELNRYYVFSEEDLSLISQRRGGYNRLGFAIMLCHLRYPGIAFPSDAEPSKQLLAFVAQQLELDPAVWSQYAERVETRREHLAELQTWLQFTPFGLKQKQHCVEKLAELAQQTEHGVVLAKTMIEMLRQQQIVIPATDVIERTCSEALTKGTRQVHERLISLLSESHKQCLDGLLQMSEGRNISKLSWLCHAPGYPSAKHILLHLERLQTIYDLGLPDGLELMIHQNRLLKLAREGRNMTTQHLRDLEAARRYATLVGVVLDAKATLIDEVIDLHDRFLRSLFSKAKRKQAEQFEESGESLTDKVRLYSKVGRALLTAKEEQSDPLAAIESVIDWETFATSILEAEQLTQGKTFNYLVLLGKNFTTVRRYAPTFLEALKIKAAPATQDLLGAIEVLRGMNKCQARKVPEDAPTSFVRKRWRNLVVTPEGIERRFYELCVLSELKNALRSGDLWVEGSRQFKDFEEYLMPKSRFTELRGARGLGLPVETDCESFLSGRLGLLEAELSKVEQLAMMDALPDAVITQKGQLKVSPLTKAVPETVTVLMQQAYALLPHVKITDLLLEVDHWTDFTGHFTHLRSREPAQERELLLTVILSDAINLGLRKMSASCPGTTYTKLTRLQAWHIRDETYSAALAEVINAQYHQPFAAWWGDGTTSSSDGQNFKAGGRGQFAGQVNLKYGQEPGVQFYTHISDQYAPFYTKVISSTVRDATHVLDGLLYHDSELCIQEHYTDTAGFTDHLFALMHFLGFRFAPRIRDLRDKRLYVNGNAAQYPMLAEMIGGNINVNQIRKYWDEILRLIVSIKQGTVTASLMLRKLGSYPRQNGLAVALRELGRIERTLFTLNWMQSLELRRRVQIGLNKGESKNALARAVFLNRLGELRDRSFENQMYRASGLNLVVAAIVLWNTVYLERAIEMMRESGQAVDEQLLKHLSPLGWEHINLTGDYVWKEDLYVKQGHFRPLRG